MHVHEPSATGETSPQRDVGRHPSSPMTPKLQALARRYTDALARHLESAADNWRETALRLGRSAVLLRVETYDLAKIHQTALVTIGAVNLSRHQTKRATRFFAEANVPIGETHQTSRATQVQLTRLKENLSRRTKELADSSRQLSRGVTRRRQMQDAFAQRSLNYKKSLEESLLLQQRLRLLTHQVLAAQESERKEISRELHDEIAQTLLGINVRLLSLKLEAKTKTKGLKQEISSTQRLVATSVRSVRRVVRELAR